MEARKSFLYAIHRGISEGDSMRTFHDQLRAIETTSREGHPEDWSCRLRAIPVLHERVSAQGVDQLLELSRAASAVIALAWGALASSLGPGGAPAPVPRALAPSFVLTALQGLPCLSAGFGGVPSPLNFPSVPDSGPDEPAQRSGRARKNVCAARAQLCCALKSLRVGQYLAGCEYLVSFYPQFSGLMPEERFSLVPSLKRCQQLMEEASRLPNLPRSVSEDLDEHLLKIDSCLSSEQFL